MAAAAVEVAFKYEVLFLYVIPNLFFNYMNKLLFHNLSIIPSLKF
jgi:hypothetical protein